MIKSITIGRWLAWLASAHFFWILVTLNILVTILVSIATFHTVGGDQYTYLGYADGLLHGRYSYWYFFPDYIPDTFRNPGYPLFLMVLKAVGLSESGIRAVQIVLYIVTIILLLKILVRYEIAKSWLARNIFLLLLLPNIQLAYFAATIFPEVLVGFLVAVYGVAAIELQAGTWKRTISLALLAGAIFQTRPVFILFPFIQVILDFWQTRKLDSFSWMHAAVMLGLFGATMLPYSLWNYQYNAVLKPTPLEGGGGVMQVGFWALRMPGYHEHRYWGNQMGEEIISFADSADVPGYIADFNQEWDSIEAQCKPLLTDTDKHYVPIMRRDYGSLFPTYSAAYTRQREKLLMQANLADIRREPGYYLKTRLYTLVRLWVTGIQLNAWRAATTPIAKLKVLYPTVVSAITFLLAVITISWGLLRRKILNLSFGWWLALSLILYFGVMHVPFAIQARYTVPVRPWLLVSIALPIAAGLTRHSIAAIRRID